MNDDERSRHEILTESNHLETELMATDKLQDSFTLSDGNLTRGQLYTKHCANCHQLAGQGKPPPQLDGAVTVNRLLEDIVTPNRTWTTRSGPRAADRGWPSHHRADYP